MNTSSGLGNNFVHGAFVSAGTIYAATRGGLSISSGGSTATTKPTKSLEFTVSFAAGSSKLSDVEKKKLLGAIAKIKSKVIKGEVVGYVQQYGDSSNSYKLSLARARVVAAFLSDHGIKIRLVASGKGELDSKAKSRKATVQLWYTK